MTAAHVPALGDARRTERGAIDHADPLASAPP